ncbi:homoserine kinase, partial [bacterium]|nr:homoserine kinase [bacterium]
SAVLAGMSAANAFLGEPLNRLELLEIANDMEGHADNAAAALFGGLCLVTSEPNGNLMVQSLPCSPWQVVVVLPDFQLPTAHARIALPEQVSMPDAVFNLGHALLAAEALRIGDRNLLARALTDRLHQPYRLKLIPGAAAAIQAAQDFGAPAALSGAGPSVIAFTDGNPQPVQSAMQNAFQAAGLNTRAWNLTTTVRGLTTDIK